MSQTSAQSLPVPTLEDEQINQAAQAQLEIICAHPLFSETSRMKRFLRYIVEESLAGRANMIKGYTIGLEVFDRPETFDSQADTIVRVQAGQLRRRLDLYYGGDGKNDPVRILMPKGSYVPRFEVRQPSKRDPAELDMIALEQIRQAEVMALNPPFGPGVLVVDFDVLSANPEDKNFALGMMTEVIEALVQFRYLRIVSRSATPAEALPPKSLKQLGVEYDSQYALSGAIRRSADLIRVSVHLIETATAEHIYSHSYDRQFTIDNLLHVQEDIASQVAAHIGAPHGVINRTMVSRLSGKVEVDAYEVVLKFYAYLIAPDMSRYEDLLAQLEAVSQAHPRFSSVWAALSLMYSFQATNDGMLKMPGEVLGKAIKAAERACAIDGGNAMAHHALGTARFHQGDVEGFKRAASRAIMRNPNDDNILAFYGLALASIGDVDLGIGFAEKALRLNANPPDWYSGPYLVKLLLARDFESALKVIKGGNVNMLWIVYVRLMCYAHLGQGNNVQDTLQQIGQLDVDYKQYLPQALDMWNFGPELRAILCSGWEKAGLDVSIFA